MKIRDFAKSNGLKISYGQRDDARLHPFYAKFEGAETKEGLFLRGEYGDGITRAQALKDYARAISGKLLVIDAYKPSRREILVPQLQ